MNNKRRTLSKVQTLILLSPLLVFAAFALMRLWPKQENEIFIGAQPTRDIGFRTSSPALSKLMQENPNKTIYVVRWSVDGRQMVTHYNVSEEHLWYGAEDKSRSYFRGGVSPAIVHATAKKHGSFDDLHP